MLIAKLFIEGIITAETGLHIGGSKGALNVGEIDNNVIKTSEGIPYIPGSSLKGKLRNLAESAAELKEDQLDKKNGICKDHKHPIGLVFGVGAFHNKYKKDKKEEHSTPTRLIVRDAFLLDDTRKAMESKTGHYSKLSMEYTEGKHENVISRYTGGTVGGGLREMERVPKGAKFSFKMVYNILEAKDIDNINVLITAMKKLEDDYLGGSGTRGYGEVKFRDIKLSIKTAKMYEDNATEAKSIQYDSIYSPIPVDEIKKAINKEVKEK